MDMTANNKLIGEYFNGNSVVKIFADGTKIRQTEDDTFVSSFPECIDLKISNRCDLLCQACHEDSTPNGLHGDILNAEFIDSLRPYTELAIGGGNPLTHPDLINFLKIIKLKNIIANITVNQIHFMRDQQLIKYLIDNDLVKGLGISLVNANQEFIDTIKQYKNVVIHVINGLVKLDELKNLYNHDLKLLILGYKKIRRGKDFYSEKIEEGKNIVYQNICDIIKGFRVTSFDNLAIKQLSLKRIFTNKDWNEFYTGDDGEHTMYIDLVKNEFAVSSTSLKRWAILPTIDEMFNIVKENK